MLTVRGCTRCCCISASACAACATTICRSPRRCAAATCRRRALLTARIVSRDTANASEAELAKASAESLLENGNDAVFGTLFWFVVAGGPGAVLFRLANTLDAMWGYRNARLLRFGCAAARIDDAVNYIPARLTALSYVLLAPGAGRASGAPGSAGARRRPRGAARTPAR